MRGRKRAQKKKVGSRPGGRAGAAPAVNLSICNCSWIRPNDLTTDRGIPHGRAASPVPHRPQCTGKPLEAHTPVHVLALTMTSYIGWELWVDADRVITIITQLSGYRRPTGPRPAHSALHFSNISDYSPYHTVSRDNYATHYTGTRAAQAVAERHCFVVLSRPDTGGRALSPAPSS